MPMTPQQALAEEAAFRDPALKPPESAPTSGITAASPTNKDELEAAALAKKKAEYEELRNMFRQHLLAQAPTFQAAIAAMMDLCEAWFTKTQGFDRQNFDGDCMLVVTELSEAVEADRKNAPSDKVKGLDGREEEIADALVRILHLGAKYNLRLPGAFVAKMHMNLDRPFKHGKGY